MNKVEKKRIRYSSDVDFYNSDIVFPAEYAFLCTDCACNLIMDNRLIIKHEEYNRLNRLDYNIKKEIIHYKTLLDAGYTSDITIPRLIEFLERLGK